MAEVAATSWSAVGRKYGVSDNAIRKWVRAYERERHEVAASGRRPAAPDQGQERGEAAGAGPPGGGGEEVRPVPVGFSAR